MDKEKQRVEGSNIKKRNQLIPKIIHQIWLGDKPVPKQLAKWREGILRHHSTKRFSGWKHYLWTDNNIQEFNAAALLDECESLAAKSDVIRLLAVAKYGGVYLDMDMECLKPLTPLLNVPAFAAREDEDTVCNAVFGAVPNHPSIIKQIQLLPAHVYQPTTWGVKLMTNFTKHVSSGVTIYPKEFFYPYLWDMPKEYRKVHEETYLIHHWSKSWVEC